MSLNSIQQTEENLNIYYKIVRGRFFWCGNTRSINRIRTNSASNKIRDYLYVEFNKSEEIPYFTIRQHPLGYGYDFQHTSLEKQDHMFFPIDDDVDRTKPFYLFSNDFKNRSKEIDLQKEYYQKGDISDCPICMDELNIEKTAILVCGHTFCENCLDIYINDKKIKCSSCKPGSYACGTVCEEYHHYDFIKCPLCKKLSY
jgi:hypothetical protein